MMKKGLSVTAAVGLLLGAGAVSATSFQVYNDMNFSTSSGDGAELVDALVGPGSGINVVPDSVAFQGNFDNSANTGESGSYGSAALFFDLNFGTLDGVDFTLPDGILLTSGDANLPLTNTSSGFTGYASQQGDAGLDALLPPDESTFDATVLTFDFTVTDPNANAITLDFIFGSEEYPEFVDAYPEIAAVFVDGVNYAGFADGSLLTLTGKTVGAGNFFDNDIWDTAGGEGPTDAAGGDYAAVTDGGTDTGTPGPSPLDIEYDGLSAPLTLTGLLDPTVTVHSIKIAVSDTIDTILDTGLFVANLQAASVSGISSPDDPVMPEDPNPEDGVFDFVIDVGDAGVGIDPTLPIFIDPIVATGYVYEVLSGPNFGSVMIPNVYGDGVYDLSIWDGSDFVFLTTFNTGDTVNFLDLVDPAGINKFLIDGIELSAGLDPADPNAFVTGLTFVGGGTVNVSMTPITQCDGSPDCASAVPEPSLLLLLGGGLLGLGFGRRRSMAA